MRIFNLTFFPFRNNPMAPAAKRFSTIPQNTTMPPASNNPLKSASFKPNFEGSSVLSGVSFNASFMDAAKKTRLGGNASNVPYEHKKVLNLGDSAAGQRRNVPTEILSDFQVPIGK
jgi:hypothetical protein